MIAIAPGEDRGLLGRPLLVEGQRGGPEASPMRIRRLLVIGHQARAKGADGPYFGHLLDTEGWRRAKPLIYLALPSGIEPLSPP